MSYFLFQIILIVCGIAIIGIYLPPLVATKALNEGNIFGYVCGAVIIAAGVFLKRIIELLKIQFITNKTLTAALLIIISVLAAAFFITFFITLHIIISHSKSQDENRDVIIILGCKINASVPSVALINRANAAAEYLKSHPKTIAIASGGQGKDEDLSEGQCIFDILTENQIDSSRILIEDKSTNTDENIRFSKKIIEEKKLSKIVAVATSDYHQYRASLICKKHGLNHSTICAQSSPKWKPTYYTREVFAVWQQWIKN